MAGFGFGKSKSRSQSTSSSESGNQAYDFLSQMLGGTTANVGGAGDAISQLLMGGRGQDQAFQTYRDNTGYDFAQQEGARGIESALANRGLRNSGAALRELDDRRTQIANGSFKDYLAQLLGLGGLGLQAGGIISDAGKYSNAESQSTGKSSAFNFSATGGPK